MDLVHLIVYIGFFVLIAYGAYLVITKFFQPPLTTILLAVVGVILLLALLFFLFPSIGNFNVGPVGHR